MLFLYYYFFFIFFIFFKCGIPIVGNPLFWPSKAFISSLSNIGYIHININRWRHSWSWKFEALLFFASFVDFSFTRRDGIVPFHSSFTRRTYTSSYAYWDVVMGGPLCNALRFSWKRWWWYVSLFLKLQKNKSRE